MTFEPQEGALVSTIIALAHSPKLNVLAKDLETEEKSTILREFDCDQMQGIPFSKPVPAAADRAQISGAVIARQRSFWRQRAERL